MSLPERMWGVIAEPVKTFQAIREDPRGLIPILVILGINLVLTFLLLPQIKEIAAEAMTQAQSMTPEQIQVAMKWVGISTVLAAVLLPPIIWLVQAALLSLFNQISLGEANFKQLYIIAFFAWIPAFIGGFIKSVLIPIMGAKKAMAVSTSLVLLLPRSTDSGFLFTLFSKVDFFSVWSLILLALGGSVAMKKEGQKVALYIFGLWLIYIVIIAFIAAKSGKAPGM